MKILLVYPKYPETFWSLKHALSFIGKRAIYPPLGLLTLAALLPQAWQKKLVDLNIKKLSDEDIKWADYVFLSAMIVQKDSIKEIIGRCKKLGVKTVAGGPMFTTGHEEFYEDVDHFMLGEAEEIASSFAMDLEKGVAKKIYKSDNYPDITKMPVPLWDLIDLKNYGSMSAQYSRGCPFNCEFCDIGFLNGRIPRFKTKEQVRNELEALYQRGWREGVFFVDDNFIGNKKLLKEEILPMMTDWMKEKGYPFSFNTQVSVNLADDKELMDMMAKAGFEIVFIGIETPDEESLKECTKFQNTNRDLLESVREIQRHGIQVQAGFIVGFDNDTPSIFERQINFIQKSGIVTAMVGILGALPKTRLYQRLKQENRLLKSTSGNNMDCSINFIPKMNKEMLAQGYKKVLKTIYSPKNYYSRVKTFLSNYRPVSVRKTYLSPAHIKAFFKSVWFLGIQGKERYYYWKLLFWSLIKQPRSFPLAVTLSVYGFHFRKISEKT